MSAPSIQLYDGTECLEVEAFLVERIYEFNARATGFHDGKLLGGAIRDGSGQVIAAFNGHTWGHCCVIAHLWVHESHRGRGFGRELLHAAETEAARRGCEQVVLSTHTFQAPSFYARLGHEPRAVVPGHPTGYANITLVKRIGAQEGA